MPENSLGASWLCNWEHGEYLHGDVLSCTLVTKQSLSLYFPVLCLIIGVGLEPRWNGYFYSQLVQDLSCTMFMGSSGNQRAMTMSWECYCLTYVSFYNKDNFKLTDINSTCYCVQQWMHFTLCISAKKKTNQKESDKKDKSRNTKETTGD